MKKITSAAVILSLCALLFSENPNILFKEYYGLNSKGTVTANLKSEKTEVKEYIGSKILIEVRGNNSSFLPEIKSSKDSVLINSSLPDSVQNIEYEVLILIPRQNSFSLDINSVTSSITATNIQNAEKFFCNSQSGIISLNNIKAAEISLKNHSGKIELNGKNFCSALTCQNFFGQSSIDNLSCDFFDIVSESGSVSVFLSSQPQAQSNIKNISGSVSLYLQPDFNINLHTFSSTGKISNKITNNILQNRIVNEEIINAGGPVINIESNSGRINIL